MSEVYERDSFLTAYIKWHYSQGLRELFGVTGNFLWFIVHFFSFKLLFKTWVAPWKRSRFLGFVTKTVVMFVGLISYILVVVFAFCVFVIWFLLPAILLGSLILALTFFII